MGQARTLLSLKDRSQMVSLANKAADGKMTVRALEGVVNKMNGQAEAKPKKRAKQKSPYLRAGENVLQEKFGTQVSINEAKEAGQGKIEIEYLSDEDLNRILDILDVHLD